MEYSQRCDEKILVLTRWGERVLISKFKESRDATGELISLRRVAGNATRQNARYFPTGGFRRYNKLLSCDISARDDTHENHRASARYLLFLGSDRKRDISGRNRR